MSFFLKSSSGPDGKLHLEIPVDRPGEYEVEVVVRSKSFEKKRDPWEKINQFRERMFRQGLGLTDSVAMIREDRDR